jgi:dsDNA-binding SOS-regulon protein
MAIQVCTMKEALAIFMFKNVEGMQQVFVTKKCTAQIMITSKSKLFDCT